MQPQPPSGPRLIAETDETIAIYAPATADGNPGPLVITFPHLTSRIDGTAFWGDAMLARAGVSGLGLMSRRPHWFVAAEMARLLPALLPVIARHQPAPIITLGFSMGATPALMHGRRLLADVSAAFSPHYSIDPRIIRDFDSRRKRTFEPARHAGFMIEEADLSPLPILFYDPLFAFDREHARRIERLSPRVRRVFTTGTGHFSVTPFERSKAGGRMLIALLVRAREATVARAARNLVRALRDATPDYHQELSTHLMQHGRPALALRAAARAAALQPQNARRQIHLRDLRQRAADAAVSPPP